MQSHPYPHSRTAGPVVRGKPALSRQTQLATASAAESEDDEEAVTLGPDLAYRAARLISSRMMERWIGQRFAVLHTELAQQPRRTLDVTEQQGERPRARRLLHQLSMTKQPRC